MIKTAFWQQLSLTHVQSLGQDIHEKQQCHIWGRQKSWFHTLSTHHFKFNTMLYAIFFSVRTFFSFLGAGFSHSSEARYKVKQSPLTISLIGLFLVSSSSSVLSNPPNKNISSPNSKNVFQKKSNQMCVFVCLWSLSVLPWLHIWKVNFSIFFFGVVWSSVLGQCIRSVQKKFMLTHGTHLCLLKGVDVLSFFFVTCRHGICPLLLHVVVVVVVLMRFRVFFNNTIHKRDLRSCALWTPQKMFQVTNILFFLFFLKFSSIYIR